MRNYIQHLKKSSRRRVKSEDGATWQIRPINSGMLLDLDLTVLLGPTIGAEVVKESFLREMGKTEEQIAEIMAGKGGLVEDEERALAARMEAAKAAEHAAPGDVIKERLAQMSVVDRLVATGVERVQVPIEDGGMSDWEDCHLVLGDPGPDEVEVSALPVDTRVQLALEIMSLTMEGAKTRAAGFRSLTGGADLPRQVG